MIASKKHAVRAKQLTTTFDPSNPSPGRRRSHPSPGKQRGKVSVVQTPFKKRDERSVFFPSNSTSSAIQFFWPCYVSFLLGEEGEPTEFPSRSPERTGRGTYRMRRKMRADLRRKFVDVLILGGVSARTARTGPARTSPRRARAVPHKNSETFFFPPFMIIYLFFSHALSRSPSPP